MWPLSEDRLLTYLEHLNKGHTEVQICLVAANQTQAEKYSNWHDCAEVDTTSHGDLFTGVENGSEAGKKLGHDGREDQMPCREEDGEV